MPARELTFRFGMNYLMIIDKPLALVLSNS